MMEGIIATMPWHCGERDCPVGWHQANYWICEDGTYSVDNDADGDHETIGQADLPTGEEIGSAWEKYRKDVRATGEDVLGEYMVDYTYRRKARYTLAFRNSIGGAMLVGWKRGRGKWSIENPPIEVRDYMLLNDGSLTNPNTKNRRPVKEVECLDDGSSKCTYYHLDEFIEVVRADETVRRVTRRGGQFHGHLTLEEDVNRKPSAIKRDLRRLTAKPTRSPLEYNPAWEDDTAEQVAIYGDPRA